MFAAVPYLFSFRRKFSYGQYSKYIDLLRNYMHSTIKEHPYMLSDPITLYKLMILYMLDHVNFPLTNSQLTDFFLDHEYTTYFTLQQALNELKEAGLIRMESTHNSSRYEITKEGNDTLSFRTISSTAKSGKANPSSSASTSPSPTRTRPRPWPATGRSGARRSTLM